MAAFSFFFLHRTLCPCYCSMECTIMMTHNCQCMIVALYNLYCLNTLCGWKSRLYLNKSNQFRPVFPDNCKIKMYEYNTLNEQSLTIPDTKHQTWYSMGVGWEGGGIMNLLMNLILCVCTSLTIIKTTASLNCKTTISSYG